MEGLVVRVSGASKSYGARRVLDSVSLDLRRGCVFGLIGANGAGKTTLIRATFAGLDPLNVRLASALVIELVANRLRRCRDSRKNRRDRRRSAGHPGGAACFDGPLQGRALSGGRLTLRQLFSHTGGER